MEMDNVVRPYVKLWDQAFSKEGVMKSDIAMYSILAGPSI